MCIRDRYDIMRDELTKELTNIREGQYFTDPIFNTIKRAKITIFNRDISKNESDTVDNLKQEKDQLTTIRDTITRTQIVGEQAAEVGKELLTIQEENKKPKPQPEPEQQQSEPEQAVKITLKDDISEANWRLINGNETRKKYIKYIHDFIEQVDTNNAISAVGTLEFMDKLSKLDMVATLCNDEGDTLIKEFDSKMVLRPLYEDDQSGGDSKRNTKRKRIPNNRTRKIRV